MEIEAPAHAIAIWSEGDKIMCRLPDRQLLALPFALGPLMAILRAREPQRVNGHGHKVGTEASPVQYDIDKIAEALKRKSADHYKAVQEKGAETRERERARLLRKDAKMQRDKAAERELRELNLL
jgi:hypothetical protein